jgi:hypothetical protein
MLILLEKLVFEVRKKIIISSLTGPNHFINIAEKNFCKKETKSTNGDSAKEDKDSDKAERIEIECPELIQRWKFVFGKFVTCEMHEVVAGMNRDWLRDNKKSGIINYSQQYSLQVASVGLKKNGGGTINEAQTLRRQQYYSQQYLWLWQSLTSEEQLILVDLAQDGLVNTLNINVLESLVARGLIYCDDNALHIVNASFRNFILTAFSSGDVKAIQADISGGSSWNDYKYPLLIVLAALVYIVVTSNPEKFGNVLPFVTGITAGIPTIIKILSYIKPATGKS